MCNCSNGKRLSTKLVKDTASIIKYVGRYYSNPILVEQSSCSCCGESEIKLFDVETKREIVI